MITARAPSGNQQKSSQTLHWSACCLATGEDVLWKHIAANCCPRSPHPFWKGLTGSLVSSCALFKAPARCLGNIFSKWLFPLERFLFASLANQESKTIQIFDLFHHDTFAIWLVRWHENRNSDFEEMIILHEGIGQGGLVNQIGDYFATFTGFGQDLNYINYIYIVFPMFHVQGMYRFTYMKGSGRLHLRCDGWVTDT